MDAADGRARGDAAPSCTPRRRELRKGLADWPPFVLAQHRQPPTSATPTRASSHDHLRGRRRRADRRHARPARRRRARPDRRPRPVLDPAFDYVREIAVRAFYDWGFNVAAVDLRSFGLTDMMSDAPSTGGWKEGEDIVARGALAEGARLDLGRRAGDLARRLLGAQRLPPRGRRGGARRRDPRGLPPADTARAERLSREVAAQPPRLPADEVLPGAARLAVRAGRWPDDIRGLVEPIEEISAPYYGVSAEEIWERSSRRTTSTRRRCRCSRCTRPTTR